MDLREKYVFTEAVESQTGYWRNIQLCCKPRITGGLIFLLLLLNLRNPTPFHFQASQLNTFMCNSFQSETFCHLLNTGRLVF